MVAVPTGSVTLWDFTGGLSASPVTGVPQMKCPKCGYNNVTDIVICWRCGECVNERIVELSKLRVKKDKKHKNSGSRTRRRR